MYYLYTNRVHFGTRCSLCGFISTLYGGKMLIAFLLALGKPKGYAGFSVSFQC